MCLLINKILSKQFGPRSGPTNCWAWSGFKRLLLKGCIFCLTAHVTTNLLISLKKICQRDKVSVLTVHIVRLFVCPDTITLSRQPIQLGKFYECKIVTFFHTHQFKHMFWVLKRTVSLKHFFWVPTRYVLDEKRKLFSNTQSYRLAWAALNIWVLLPAFWIPNSLKRLYSLYYLSGPRLFDTLKVRPSWSWTHIF